VFYIENWFWCSCLWCFLLLYVAQLMITMYTLLSLLLCGMHWSVCAFLMVCMFPPNKLPSAAWTRCWYVSFLQTVSPANSVSCDVLLLFLLLPVSKMCLVSALVCDFLQLSICCSAGWMECLVSLEWLQCHVWSGGAGQSTSVWWRCRGVCRWEQLPRKAGANTKLLYVWVSCE